MSLINTALSGLLAAQRGLDVTANNVANSATDGYVRRRIVQAEAVAPAGGISANVGNGVNVIDVQRIYDQFVTEQLRGQVSSEQRAQAYSDFATRLDNLVGGTDTGLSTSIQSFYDQVELLARDPTSTSNREQVLQQANSLALRFQQIDTQINALDDEIDQRIQDSVNRVNDIAASLAKINASLAQGGQAASNDLADQRDTLLRQLGEQVDAKIITQSDGSVTVLVGNGQPLVIGITSARLQAIPDQFNPSHVQVAFNSGSGPQLISRQISGGNLGGLLAFRSEALQPARRDLGVVAQGLAANFNAQHKLGVDAAGNLGGNFFSTIAPTAAAGAGNSGSASVTASIVDPTRLASRDYQLRYDGTNWQLTDASTGTVVPATGTGTAADPFIVDGLSIVVAGAANSGDRFLVQAASGAAGRFAVAITDGRQIAAATPLAATAALTNLSGAAISAVAVANVTNPALLQSVQIVFDDAVTYRIRSATGTDLTGPLAYTSGADISFNGWTTQVNGAPEAGDTFLVQPTGPASGDNSNALALAKTNARGFFGGGTQSIDDFAARMVTTLGTTALRATQDAKVQTALRSQVQQASDNYAGVNLDEEASNMLKYQQAYQAAGKIIVIANDLFQTLLNMVR